MTTNRFRLTSSHYERETKDEQIEPQKIYFIAVEGNRTEKEYFDGISQYRKDLGINALVDVEVLNRSSKDGRSAPDQVVELLEEYLLLREADDDLSNDIPIDVLNTYGREFVQMFLDDPSSIPTEKRNRFTNELRKIGYDIYYRHYLKKYNNETDEFCIMIDRDKQSHSEEDMAEIIKYCKLEDKQYHCYIANPCFEFWLLLHLSDVKTEYANQLDQISANPKISNHHTFVSYEVSKKAHHSKGKINFKNNYLPFISLAIARAKQFASSETDLISDIGCNLWKLIEEMQNTTSF